MKCLTADEGFSKWRQMYLLSPRFQMPAAFPVRKKIKMAAFKKQKASCLSQVDISKKGSIDDQIMDLVQYINAKENYFTTSSCSGRISVFSEVSQFVVVY